MKKNLPACSCSIKSLKPKELVAAAQYAISLNRANMPALGGPDKWAMAVQTSKYWGPAGVHLTVGFMESTAANLQERIVNKFNEWGRYCNASFAIVQGATRNADVRISRGAGGYWSYMGSDIHRVSATQPTMNLQGFSMQTPEAELNRVGLHEIAHSMGAPHEHMRPQIINLLDYDKTVRVYRRDQGWDEQTVRQQIFTELSESLLIGTSKPFEDSIMCYWFSGECTKSGRPILGGNKISKEDGEFIATVYPKEITLPPAAKSVKITIEFDPDSKNAKVIGVM